MSRESVLILLAALVVVAPFSGLPVSWLEIILPVIGALVLLIGISLRRSRQNSDTTAPAAE